MSEKKICEDGFRVVRDDGKTAALLHHLIYQSNIFPAEQKEERIDRPELERERDR